LIENPANFKNQNNYSSSKNQHKRKMKKTNIPLINSQKENIEFNPKETQEGLNSTKKNENEVCGKEEVFKVEDNSNNRIDQNRDNCSGDIIQDTEEAYKDQESIKKNLTNNIEIKESNFKNETKIMKENISSNSLENRESKTCTNSNDDKYEINKLDDSTNELRAEKLNYNLEDNKSTTTKNTRGREDSILTEIQENFNENNSPTTTFLINNHDINMNSNNHIYKDQGKNASESELKDIEKDASEKSKLNSDINNEINIEYLSNRKIQLKLFLDKALNHKIIANELFKKKKFAEAIKEYINVIILKNFKYTILYIFFMKKRYS